MAVAVSMLMIGGEFDLSAGAMTGAMGILVILLSKEAGEFGGAGLTLWIAIPLSLAVALGDRLHERLARREDASCRASPSRSPRTTC